MRNYPQRWIVYDTETVSRPSLTRRGVRELTLRLGCAVYDEPGLNFDRGTLAWSFTDSKGFHDPIETLAKTDEPIWIFAHNHSFDARIVGFYRELAQGRYSLMPPEGTKRRGVYREPLFLIDGPPYLARLWRPDGQALMLADTFNWLDMSLAKIGDKLGYPKLDMPHEDAPEGDWLAYCWRDVEITELALNAIWGFARRLSIVHWQPTIASQSMQLWKSRYGSRKVKMPKDRDLLHLDRHAYYGGRTEAFRLGKIEGPITQVDVNSMYPCLMQNSLFPKEIDCYELDPSAKTAGPPPHPAQTTAEVWLDSPDTAYPVRCQEGTLYVRGNVRTILCGPELRRACEQGHVASHGRWCRYRMSPLFAGFVSDLWALRLARRNAGDAIGDRLAKMMMDSLFGKFGQRQGDWVTLGTDYPADHYGRGIVVGGSEEYDTEWRIIAGVYQRRLRETLADHAFVPIAAFTTAYGRVFMDAVRSKLWASGVYYQATDSLLIDDGNMEMLWAAELMGVDEIGKFRKEDQWDAIDIRGHQWIERAVNPVRAGLPRTAESINSSVYEWDRWEQTLPGICKGSVSSVSVVKTLTRLRETYSRQNVLASGQCVPWVACNWSLTPEHQKTLPLLRDRDQG